MLARGIRIDHLDRIRVGYHTGKINNVLFQRFAQRPTHNRFGGEAHINQYFSQQLMFLFLFGECDMQLVFTDNAVIN